MRQIGRGRSCGNTMGKADKKKGMESFVFVKESE